MKPYLKYLEEEQNLHLRRSNNRKLTKNGDVSFAFTLPFFTIDAPPGGTRQTAAACKPYLKFAFLDWTKTAESD